MPNTISVKVRGYHLDVYGHVNNARYLEFLEEARWAMLEHMDLEALLVKGILFVVVNININYRRPAGLNSLLTVESTLKSVGTHSAVLSQVVKFKENGNIAADAEVTFVLLNSKTHQPMKLEGDLAQLLSAIG